ncbi:hypothetical protein MKW98_029693 [Papaver atlanticum]|uniref:peptidylprolyl isomerase n=1 Tax=Papaver atlanticum TaxID=357466 RepID=A0AAD4T7U1_9MAGN|nr:hypothetical protein MKW98_029693 [Papaver atlanticum]
MLQATLGVTTAEHTSRTVVQCKIGNNTPIFLCSFRQFKKESCSVDIDFGEDVVFEVIGIASVHLAGSYLGNGHSSEDKPSGTGLVVEFLALGNNPNAKVAAPGTSVTVHYTGKFRCNGSQYISTIGGQPFTFRLGKHEIIKGWELGLVGI